MRLTFTKLRLCLGIILLAACRSADAQPPDTDSNIEVTNNNPTEWELLEPAVDVSNITRADESTDNLASTASDSSAMDMLNLEATSITGTQELPKVLYIVPWQKSDLGDLVGRPVGTLIDEVLEPVDPEVFQRHLDYYDGLYGKGQEE